MRRGQGNDQKVDILDSSRVFLFFGFFSSTAGVGATNSVETRISQLDLFRVRGNIDVPDLSRLGANLSLRFSSQPSIRS